MKTAYITGATGCLGRNLVDVLLADQWDIIVLHRKSSDLSRLKGCNVKFQEADLYEIDSVRKSMGSNADAIFHIAGNTSHWAAEAEKQWKDNVLVTRNLAAIALEKSVKRFIFTSTGATLNYQGWDEGMSQKIEGGYTRTKHLAELEVYKAVEAGLDAVVLHPIIVVGAYDYNSYSQIFINMKKEFWPVAFPGKIAFCHAGDVAAAHLQAFYKGRCCEHYVLGGTYTTWLDFFQKVAVSVGAKPPTKATPRWLLSIIAHAMVTVSFFTKKRPLLSPDLVNLLRDAPDVSYCEKRKAKEDLGYESASIDKMIEDCRDWLKSEGLLSPA
jgi:dihydroflavonol-4-reductase